MTAKAKPKPKATKSTQNKSEDVGSQLLTGPTEMIAIERLLDDPKNPRTIDEHDPRLTSMSKSIEQFGILEPLLLRPTGTTNADGLVTFWIMAGHRRRTAALKAGRTVVPCIVYHNATEATATQIRITENLEREDLNPIETARELQTAMDVLGMSQHTLSERFSRSQAWVSHHLRLLLLPVELQDAIASGLIKKTQGRELAVLADVPAVMQEFIEAYNSFEWAEDQDCLDRNDFWEMWSSAVNSHLPIYQTWMFKLSEAQLKRLDLREVGIYRRVVNLEAFDALKAEYDVSPSAPPARPKASEAPDEDLDTNPDDIDADEDTEETSDTNGVDADDADLDIAPATNQATDKPSRNKATEVKKPESGDPQFNKRVYRYYMGWLQSQIQERAVHLTDEDLFRWVGGLAVNPAGGTKERVTSLAKAIAKVYGKHPDKTPPTSQAWDLFLELPGHYLSDIFTEWVCEWARLECRSWSTDANPAGIIGIARLLGIDLGKWQPDQEFLELHTVEQLGALVREWKLPIKATTKSDLIAAILDKTGLTVPSYLKKVVPCRLD